MKNFVEAIWLNENLKREDIIILDARADLKDSKLGLKEYQKSHIESAQFVDLEKTMTGELKAHGGRHPLPDIYEFRDKMQDLGINNSSTVIVYDSGNLAMAGRLWWMLKYIGLENVYILEGGFKQWEIKGYPTTDKVLQKEKGDLSLNINKEMLSDIEEVKEAINSKDKVVVDSRAEERYLGKVEPLDRLPGHIPNAINFPWTNLIELEEYMNLKQLEEYFKPLQKYDEIIVHCGSGITGTVNILFMNEIGLNPKLYLGGYSDWVSYEELEVISDF